MLSLDESEEEENEKGNVNVLLNEQSQIDKVNEEVISWKLNLERRRKLTREMEGIQSTSQRDLPVHKAAEHQKAIKRNTEARERNELTKTS